MILASGYACSTISPSRLLSTPLNAQAVQNNKQACWHDHELPFLLVVTVESEMYHLPGKVLFDGEAVPNGMITSPFLEMTVSFELESLVSRR